MPGKELKITLVISASHVYPLSDNFYRVINRYRHIQSLKDIHYNEFLVWDIEYKKGTGRAERMIEKMRRQYIYYRLRSFRGHTWASKGYSQIIKINISSNLSPHSALKANFLTLSQRHHTKAVSSKDVWRVKFHLHLCSSKRGHL